MNVGMFFSLYLGDEVPGAGIISGRRITETKDETFTEYRIGENWYRIEEILNIIKEKKCIAQCAGTRVGQKYTPPAIS